MPTVLRIGPYRFFFYAGDHNEPPHIHVEHNNNTAKFWLNPVRLKESRAEPTGNQPVGENCRSQSSPVFGEVE